MCFSSKKYKALQSQALQPAQDPNAPRSYASTDQGTPIATTMAPMQTDPNLKGFAALAAMSQQPGGLRMASTGQGANYAAQPMAKAVPKMMGASRVIS